MIIPFEGHRALKGAGTVAVALSGHDNNALTASLSVLDLSGLYPWDAPVARWAYDECCRRGIGSAFSLA